MHKTIKAHVAAILGMFAIAASAQPATFGEGLKTPGYEDVVILDRATFHMVAGADDGVVAGHIAAAYRDAQVAPIGFGNGSVQLLGNKRSISLSERVFARHLPGIPGRPSERVTPSRVDVQKMLLKRKQDVVNAKRFLLPLQLRPLLAGGKEGVNGESLLLRDKFSRYVLRLETEGGLSHSYWHKDDGTGEVSFNHCRDAEMSYTWVNLINYKSRHGLSESCIGIPDFKGLNLPAGVFVSDLSKFGNLDEWRGAMHSGSSTYSPILAGIVVTPNGRSGTARGRVGRNFDASELLIWDETTMQVLAGPFSLKGRDPDVLYATNNCQKKLYGTAVVLQLPGNCDKLNPTLNPEFMIEMQPE